MWQSRYSQSYSIHQRNISSFKAHVKPRMRCYAPILKLCFSTHAASIPSFSRRSKTSWLHLLLQLNIQNKTCLQWFEAHHKFYEKKIKILVLSVGPQARVTFAFDFKVRVDSSLATFVPIRSFSSVAKSNYVSQRRRWQEPLTWNLYFWAWMWICVDTFQDVNICEGMSELSVQILFTSELIT